MIGERLRELRLAQGKSLADVAAGANVSVATLSRIENGKQSLEVDLLLTLARLLRASAADLLDPRDDADGGGDTLARRIASLETKKRAELWRDIAAERRTRRDRRRPSPADVVQQVEEILAQVEVLREELQTVRRRMRHRKNGA